MNFGRFGDNDDLLGLVGGNKNKKGSGGFGNRRRDEDDGEDEAQEELRRLQEELQAIEDPDYETKRPKTSKPTKSTKENENLQRPATSGARKIKEVEEDVDDLLSFLEDVDKPNAKKTVAKTAPNKAAPAGGNNFFGDVEDDFLDKEEEKEAARKGLKTLLQKPDIKSMKDEIFFNKSPAPGQPPQQQRGGVSNFDERNEEEDSDVYIPTTLERRAQSRFEQPKSVAFNIDLDRPKTSQSNVEAGKRAFNFANQDEQGGKQVSALAAGKPFNIAGEPLGGGGDDLSEAFDTAVPSRLAKRKMIGGKKAEDTPKDPFQQQNIVEAVPALTPQQSKPVDRLMTSTMAGVQNTTTVVQNQAVANLKLDTSDTTSANARFLKQANDHLSAQLKLKEEENKTLKELLDAAKRTNEEFVERLKQDHTRENDFWKQEKAMMQESFEKMMNLRLDQMKIQHELELQTKERLMKVEAESKTSLLQEQIISLKLQLENQLKLKQLEEEIRTSSGKVAQMHELYATNKKGNEKEFTEELLRREQLINERELRLNQDKELTAAGLARIEKMRAEIDTREIELKAEIAREREACKQEYNRVLLLQEQNMRNETDRRKEIATELQRIEVMKGSLAREKDDLKAEYEGKYQAFELQASIFEEKRKEFEKIIAEQDETVRGRALEIENLRKKLIMEEADMLKRKKAVDMAEFELTRRIDEFQAKYEAFMMEREQYAREAQRAYEISQQLHKENEAVVEFKRNYNDEKEKLVRMKMDLDNYAQSLKHDKMKLQTEKSQMNHMQRTLEEIRHNTVKAIDDKLRHDTYNEHERHYLDAFANKYTEQPYKTLGGGGASFTSNNNPMSGRPPINSAKQRPNSGRLRDPKEVVPFNLDRYLDGIRTIADKSTSAQNYLQREKEALDRKTFNVSND